MVDEKVIRRERKSGEIRKERSQCADEDVGGKGWGEGN